MYQDITGVILSGGKSSRMGTNKSNLILNGKSIIERTTDLMSGIFEKVVLITNEPDLYTHLNLNIYEDIYKGFGPLGGIHSGLINSTTDQNFIISCDAPLINFETIKFITDYPTDKLLKIPEADGFVQQLCGIYSKKVLTEIETILNESEDQETRDNLQKKRKCKVHRLIDSVDSCIINMETEYPEYSSNLFFNMNHIEDYEFVKNLIK